MLVANALESEEKMNSHSQQIKSDVDSFQGYVQILSENILLVASLWRDSQYSALASGVSAVAVQSRDVLITGDKLCESIDKFFDIANEKY